MSGHFNIHAHWLPRPVEESPITACGLNVDGPCENHLTSRHPEDCHHGLAWTRSRDLAKFADEPYGPKLKACPACSLDASS